MEKRTFFVCSNNSVTAVVTRETYEKLMERNRLIQECESLGLPKPELPPVRPVFTFSRSEHPSFRLMTGSDELLDRLLSGHNVERGCIWVPFSNGVEHRSGEEGRWEQMFRTSLDEAMTAFGLVVPIE